jgi:hypothetical protein
VNLAIAPKWYSTAGITEMLGRRVVLTRRTDVAS